MSALDVDAMRKQAEPWLQQCGPHDFGMPEHGCKCPSGDPRPVVAALLTAVERLTAELDAYKRVVNGGIPDHLMGRHDEGYAAGCAMCGRDRAEMERDRLRAALAEARRQRDEARQIAEQIRLRGDDLRGFPWEDHGAVDALPTPEPETARRPSPADLWQQANGEGDEYRRLMRHHGHLIDAKPGEDPDLPCGWPGRGVADEAVSTDG